jgi:hypothetical protein
MSEEIKPEQPQTETPSEQPEASRKLPTRAQRILEWYLMESSVPEPLPHYNRFGYTKFRRIS